VSDASDPTFVEITRGPVTWRFERQFLTSNWTCLFGRGCKGILDHPAEELQQGCCSLGAHFGDGEPGREEARRISAYAALLDPERWQYHDAAQSEPGVFGDLDRAHTRVVDGACIFLNRPGFGGGVGCALHLAAVDSGESPTEWKPSVCWQLPLRVDWAPIDDEREAATVRRWTRRDWTDIADSMAWCCTERSEGGEAYVGDEHVVDSMRDELTVLAGEEVWIELRRRLDDQET
jgi:hypothetical protein